MKQDLVIAKQEEYITYLNKVIDSESIVSAISLGVRGKYESELASLKQGSQEKESLREEVPICKHCGLSEFE